MCDKHMSDLENSNPEKELSRPARLAMLMTLMMFSAQLCAALFEDEESDTIEITSKENL